MLLVSFPGHILCISWKYGSDQLPIPFSFKSIGMLVHCSFLNFTIDSGQLSIYSLTLGDLKLHSILHADDQATLAA